MKKFLLATGLALASTQSYAALAMGDLAFNSFNADEDGFSIVALANITPATVIHFQDNEWVNTGSGNAFNTGETTMTWNTGASTINAGTVIRFSTTDASPSATVGTLTGGANLNATAEAIYAFTGSNNTTPTTFLAALSTDTAVNLSLAGFTVGLNAVVITSSADYAGYTGLRNNKASFAAYAGQVNNAINWTVQVDGASVAGVAPSMTAFTVTPVPEPAEYAMLGLGLAVVGAVARRRNRK